LELSKKYESFSAEDLLKDKQFPLKQKLNKCLCPEVIKGKIKPLQCPQFKKSCSPQNPLGPCMVSFEGICRIYYEYAA
jgi:hydrogenase expression/formation protein HypD